MQTLFCESCESDVVPVARWQPIAGGRRHIRAECPHCGRYIKFLPQTPDNVALADSAPAVPHLLSGE